jgi:hypothetical protein
VPAIHLSTPTTGDELTNEFHAKTRSREEGSREAQSNYSEALRPREKNALRANSLSRLRVFA